MGVLGFASGGVSSFVNQAGVSLTSLVAFSHLPDSVTGDCPQKEDFARVSTGEGEGYLPLAISTDTGFVGLWFHFPDDRLFTRVYDKKGCFSGGVIDNGGYADDDLAFDFGFNSKPDRVVGKGLANGEFISCWSTGIYHQCFTFDDTAKLTGSIFEVLFAGSNIGPLSDGNFLASLVGNPIGIVKYSANGGQIGEGFEILIRDSDFNIADFDSLGGLATLNDDSFVVAYSINNIYAPDRRIYAQRYSADYIFMNNFTVAIGGSYSQYPLIVEGLREDKIFIGWENEGGYYGQVFSKDGDRLHTDDFYLFAFESSESTKPVPSLAPLLNGGFVSSSGKQIFLYSKIGIISNFDIEFEIEDNEDLVISTSSVAPTPDGDFVVFWSAEGGYTSTKEIYGQRYDENGKPVGLQESSTSLLWLWLTLGLGLPTALGIAGGIFYKLKGKQMIKDVRFVREVLKHFDDDERELILGMLEQKEDPEVARIIDRVKGQLNDSEKKRDLLAFARHFRGESESLSDNESTSKLDYIEKGKKKIRENPEMVGKAKKIIKELLETGSSYSGSGDSYSDSSSNELSSESELRKLAAQMYMY